ncbi:MAG: hypothetical protein KQJ78_10285 [Deltaproteobacteria bacterium]|nr:hypothetical protein [Deltaproteobacteria bacterium]
MTHWFAKEQRWQPRGESVETSLWEILTVLQEIAGDDQMVVAVADELLARAHPGGPRTQAA